jgi:hypothetical protein
MRRASAEKSPLTPSAICPAGSSSLPALWPCAQAGRFMHSHAARAHALRVSRMRPKSILTASSNFYMTFPAWAIALNPVTHALEGIFFRERQETEPNIFVSYYTYQ